LKERLGTQLFKVQVHDCDELLDTSLRKDQDLLDIEAWLKAEDAKNKPPEPVDVPDPKKKGGKEVKKEPPKKEAPKKDTKKKDVKLGEPVRDPQPQRSYNRNNYGIAAYYLSDLLKPNVRTVKLQAPVVPRKQFEDVESSNLDLNTTAK
jgi:outer membrane biosynthesis protein TonB